LAGREQGRKMMMALAGCGFQRCADKRPKRCGMLTQDGAMYVRTLWARAWILRAMEHGRTGRLARQQE